MAATVSGADQVSCRVWVRMRNTLCEQMFSASPPNSDIPRCGWHFAFVPVAAIEDEGTILYSIVTCFLPDAPKSILVEEDTRGSEMLPEPIAYCFYHYRRLFFHTWIVTTFTIIMAAAPLRASVTPKASA